MSGISKYIVALTALLLLGCGPKEDQFVDVKAAAERMSRGELLLDVREADDYKEFHAPGSMNIPFGRLKYRIAELEPYKAKSVMLIDHAGIRAARAWEILEKAGFSQVSVVKGGMGEWKESGLPLATLEMQMEKERELQLEADRLERELEALRKEASESAETGTQ